MYMTKVKFLELFQSSSDMKECISDYWEDWFGLNEIDTDEENKYGGRKKSTKEYNKRREIKGGQYSFDMMTYAVMWVRAKGNEKRQYEKRREFAEERTQYSDTIRKLKQEIEDLKTTIPLQQPKMVCPPVAGGHTSDPQPPQPLQPEQKKDYSFLESEEEEEEKDYVESWDEFQEGSEDDGAGVGFDDGESSAVSEVSEPEKTPQEIIYEKKLAEYEEHLHQCKVYKFPVEMKKPVPP